MGDLAGFCSCKLRRLLDDLYRWRRQARCGGTLAMAATMLVLPCPSCERVRAPVLVR